MSMPISIKGGEARSKEQAQRSSGEDQGRGPKQVSVKIVLPVDG